ncbi:MAG: hypothetical protein V8S33_00695 [Intestinibacter bartlettii]
MDSKIDNGDINQIMDNFVSKKDYTILKFLAIRKTIKIQIKSQVIKKIQVIRLAKIAKKKI